MQRIELGQKSIKIHQNAIDNSTQFIRNNTIENDKNKTENDKNKTENDKNRTENNKNKTENNYYEQLLLSQNDNHDQQQIKNSLLFRSLNLEIAAHDQKQQLYLSSDLHPLLLPKSRMSSPRSSRQFRRQGHSNRQFNLQINSTDYTKNDNDESIKTISKLKPDVNESISVRSSISQKNQDKDDSIIFRSSPKQIKSRKIGLLNKLHMNLRDKYSSMEPLDESIFDSPYGNISLRNKKEKENMSHKTTNFQPSSKLPLISLSLLPHKGKSLRYKINNRLDKSLNYVFRSNEQISDSVLMSPSKITLFSNLNSLDKSVDVEDINNRISQVFNKEEDHIEKLITESKIVTLKRPELKFNGNINNERKIVNINIKNAIVNRYKNIGKLQKKILKTTRNSFNLTDQKDSSLLGIKVLDYTNNFANEPNWIHTGKNDNYCQIGSPIQRKKRDNMIANNQIHGLSDLITTKRFVNTDYTKDKKVK